MKLNPKYFIPGVQHLCMFCDTPIGKVTPQGLWPLGNKAHVLLSKSTPGIYTINCCADCAKKVDFKDQTTLDQIHDNVVKCKRLIAPDYLPDENEKLVSGFSLVETDPSRHDVSLKQYETYRATLEKAN